MLAQQMVDKVQRLLAKGKLSQRKIAQLMGVSRGTIGLIAAGKRHNPVPVSRPWDVEADEPLGPPGRCPSCGGWVYLPCRLCRTRRFLAKQKKKDMQRPTAFTGKIEVAGLVLKPNHQQRYEEICRRRQQLGIVEEDLELDQFA